MNRRRNSEVEALFRQGTRLADEAGDAGRSGDKDQARQLNLRSLEAFREALKLSPRDGEILIALGARHFENGEVNQAIRCYEMALPLLETIGDQELLMKAMFNCAGAHYSLGLKSQALREIQAAHDLEWQKRHLKEVH